MPIDDLVRWYFGGFDPPHCFQVGNKKLKITDYHLIYTNDCNLKDPLRLLYAKDLRKGQCLYSIESQSSFQPVKILSIERVFLHFLFKSILISF